MENKDLKEILISELETMHEVIGIMEMENEAQFIAVALPNLHLALFEWLQSKQKRIERAIGLKYKLFGASGCSGNEEVNKLNAVHVARMEGYNQAILELKPIISNILKS